MQMQARIHYASNKQDTNCDAVGGQRAVAAPAHVRLQKIRCREGDVPVRNQGAADAAIRDMAGLGKPDFVRRGAKAGRRSARRITAAEGDASWRWTPPIANGQNLTAFFRFMGCFLSPQTTKKSNGEKCWLSFHKTTPNGGDCRNPSSGARPLALCRMRKRQSNVLQDLFCAMTFVCYVDNNRITLILYVI